MLSNINANSNYRLHLVALGVRSAFTFNQPFCVVALLSASTTIGAAPASCLFKAAHHFAVAPAGLAGLEYQPGLAPAGAVVTPRDNFNILGLVVATTGDLPPSLRIIEPHVLSWEKVGDEMTDAMPSDDVDYNYYRIRFDAPLTNDPDGFTEGGMYQVLAYPLTRPAVGQALSDLKRSRFQTAN